MGILDGEKSYIFIALYTLDFLICMTLLVLFHMYSRKSTTDEERLKKYYLMSLRGREEAPPPAPTKPAPLAASHSAAPPLTSP